MGSVSCPKDIAQKNVISDSKLFLSNLCKLSSISTNKKVTTNLNKILLKKYQIQTIKLRHKEHLKKANNGI
ncbi:hypothetical protein OA097_00150 [bacterium]|nr:hypothetical protein [bacterium]